MASLHPKTLSVVRSCFKYFVVFSILSTLSKWQGKRAARGTIYSCLSFSYCYRTAYLSTPHALELIKRTYSVRYMSSATSAISKNCVWLGTGFEFGIIRRTCKVAHFVHSFEQMLSKTAFEFGIIGGTFVHVAAYFEKQFLN